jgi:1-acyl-sn-glycerol-3-phosphate acyltransferase
VSRPLAISPKIARKIAKLLNRKREDQLDLSFTDAGHGYDIFGLNKDYVAFGDAIVRWIYEDYFRVKSIDNHNIPASGAAILAANHSGTLPIDAMMIWEDVLRNTTPNRAVRSITDHFVPTLPFFSTLFARCGAVGGSRGNAQALLEAGELLSIFPEGVPGISKLYSKKYQLQTWRKGHCALSIRFRAPVIPVGIIGAEEQMPTIAHIPAPKPLPDIPIPITPIPLPVRYYIIYGEPIAFHEEFSPEDADNPEIVLAAAARVKAAVEVLIARGLKERVGVFS